MSKDSKEAKKNDITMSLNDLKINMGWGILVKEMEKNIGDIEKDLFDETIIIPDVSAENARLARLIIKRNNLKELIKLPDTIISLFKIKDIKPKDFDPYEK